MLTVHVSVLLHNFLKLCSKNPQMTLKLETGNINTTLEACQYDGSLHQVNAENNL